MTSPDVRLLLVDDAEDLRFLLRLTFDRHPRVQIVGEAGDGDEALALIAEQSPDLVLLDIEMPRRNGLEVLDALRSATDRPVVVMLSGVSTELLREGATERGADGFVEKSVRPAALLDQVLAIHDAARPASASGGTT